ncbi:MAG: GAF domain-containing protein [Anaerolineae bacterium]|jgi:GAF domain-containing protein/HAMP domain-containing protein
MLFGIRWGSLRTKIIAWSFVPTAIILGAVALVTFLAYQQVTEELVIERNRELTRLTADQLNAELKEYANLLAAEARRADIFGKDPVAQRAALREAQNRLAVFDSGVLLINTFGTVVAAEPERPEIMDQNWSDRAYYRQVLRSVIRSSPGAAISDIIADGPAGSQAAAIAVPITGPTGEFVGVLAGMLQVDLTLRSSLRRSIEKLRIREHDKAYIVDGTGRLVYHSDPARVGEDLSAQPVVQQVLAKETDAIRTRDLEGSDIVASYAPIPGTSWGLVTEESWRGLLGASQAYGSTLLLLLALGVVVPAVVVAVGVRRLTRPISELIDAADKVAGGNFGHTITADTGDEIEELAGKFNRMSAQLKSSYANLEHRVAVRTKELAALNAIASVVSQSLDLDETLDGALSTTMQVMEVEAGGIYLLDERTGTLIVAAQQGFSPRFVAGVDGLKVGEGFSGRVIESGQPLVVNDASADPRLTRMVVREEGLRSLAIVPLRSKGQVLGTLFAMTHGYREFTDQDVQLLSSIGHQIGVAVDSARLFQAEQRRAEQFRVITGVGHRITSILDIDELLIQLVRLIQKSFKYDHVAIAMIEGGKAEYKVGAGSLWDNPEFEFQPRKLAVGQEGLTGWVAATGEPVLVPDVSQDPHYVPLAGSGTQSELIVPIKVKGQVIGVLDVQSDRLNAFDDSDLVVLQSLANQAAIAIENARLFVAEQRRAEQFRVIGEVGRHMTTILDIDQLLEEIVSLIRDTFGYYLVDIALIEGDDLNVRAGAGDRFGDPDFQPPNLEVEGPGIMARVARTGEPLLVPDVSQEPLYCALPDGLKTQSELAVPLKTKTSVIGVLDVQSDRLDAFDDSDLVMLQALAHQAAFAIENARFFRDTTRQVRELRALADASRIISSVLDQDQLLRALYEQITRIAPTDFYVIALYDSDANVVSIEINVDEGVHYPKEQYVLDRGLLQLVIHERRALRFDNLPEAKAHLDVEVVPGGGPKANESWLGVPMLYGEEVLGAIVVGSYQPSAFDAGHQQTLTSIGNQAAVALKNARLYEQAQQLAVMEERQRLARELHDAVTQTLFSASLIAEALPELWESDQSEGRQLLSELRQLSRGALAEMRTLLLELRPAALVEASLNDLLRQLGEATTGRTGAPVRLTAEGQAELPPDVHVAIYRIAQEALNNVVKHARACEVTVQLRRALIPYGDGRQHRARLELLVSDDGCGFDPTSIPPHRLGLGIIRERAEAINANLSIESKPGCGTCIRVVWQEAKPSVGATIQ